MNNQNHTPYRQIRAIYDESTIRVYQAYRPEIAEPALREQTFVPPFGMSRMTWIKPSFLWMMYRCGWAKKPGQERVLGIDIDRDGFNWALRNACLSHFDETIHSSQEQWKQQVTETAVRVQWDPERDIHFEKLDHRSIQIGLSGDAVTRYVKQWIKGIEDVTPLADELFELMKTKQYVEVIDRLPEERPYPVTFQNLGMIDTDEDN